MNDDVRDYILSMVSQDNPTLPALGHRYEGRTDIQPAIGPEVGKLLQAQADAEEQPARRFRHKIGDRPGHARCQQGQQRHPPQLGPHRFRRR